jgi:hypothetical protein
MLGASVLKKMPLHVLRYGCQTYLARGNRLHCDAMQQCAAGGISIVNP